MGILDTRRIGDSRSKILYGKSLCIPMLRKLKYITQYLYSKFVFFKIFLCICMAIYDLSDCMSVIRHMTYILVIP